MPTTTWSTWSSWWSLLWTEHIAIMPTVVNIEHNKKQFQQTFNPSGEKQLLSIPNKKENTCVVEIKPQQSHLWVTVQHGLSVQHCPWAPLAELTIVDLNQHPEQHEFLHPTAFEYTWLSHHLYQLQVLPARAAWNPSRVLFKTEYNGCQKLRQHKCERRLLYLRVWNVYLAWLHASIPLMIKIQRLLILLQKWMLALLLMLMTMVMLLQLFRVVLFMGVVTFLMLICGSPQKPHQ